MPKHDLLISKPFFINNKFISIKEAYELMYIYTMSATSVLSFRIKCVHYCGRTSLHKFYTQKYRQWIQRLSQGFVVVVLLFYVRGKHLRSCRDGQLT